jgi:general secretion pathway protein G
MDTDGEREIPILLRKGSIRGFTLIELLVVLTILALLLSLAAPRYFHHIDQSKEAVLRQNLATMREALDQYHADKDAWPGSLEQLVKDRYLRAMPVDPMTTRFDTWLLIPGEGGAGVRDVASGAPGQGSDGKAYAEW